MGSTTVLTVTRTSRHMMFAHFTLPIGGVGTRKKQMGRTACENAISYPYFLFLSYFSSPFASLLFPMKVSIEGRPFLRLFHNQGAGKHEGG